MTYSGIRLGLYEPMKQVISPADPKSTSLAVKVASGAITGVLGSVIANPFDLVKVRMQGTSAASDRAAYPSVAAALREIRQEGSGISGLWRGSTVTVCRASLLTAAQVPSYDHVKHLLVDSGYLSEGYACHFVCSMIAGVIAAAVTIPVDLIKSRVMMQPVDPTT